MITNKRTNIFHTALFAAALLFADIAVAEGDIDAGEELAYSCLGCHGIEGYRNAYPSYRVPKLGGQKAAYLELALKGYRDGNREHPTMQAQASSLSDQDIEDVVTYLASKGSETVEAVSSDSSASGGISLKAAEPCAACHGPTGISMNALWPTLAGQHQDYLLRSLQSYIDGSRKDVVMAGQAALIAEEDIEILARYFSRLDGLETTEVD
jgi:cytochrome c553